MPAFAVGVVRCSLLQHVGASIGAALFSIHTFLTHSPPIPSQGLESRCVTSLSDATLGRVFRRRGSNHLLGKVSLRIHAPTLRLRRVETAADAATLARRAELHDVAMEAWDIFHSKYVDNPRIDWERIRMKLERRRITSEPELHAAIDWMLSQAHDQFTRFLPRNELDSMKSDIDGEMCGVGIVFTAETYGWRRAKRVVVKDVVAKSPAADAGISRGDEISAIDMVSVRQMSVDEATNRLLGKEGQKLSLSFVRCDDQLELTVTLTRRRFMVPTVTAEAVFVPDVGRVAFLQIREFAASTALQARRSVRRLLAAGAINAYVLDLRDNSGGLVDQAVEFAKVFLGRERIIVRFVGRHNVVTTEKSNVRWFCRYRVRVSDEPLVILVDEATASASELVAAALRDNCRAVIVGTSTYGKGSVQAISQLSDGAGVAVTVARYRTPCNSPIHTGQGLKPDLYRPNLPNDSSVVAKLFGSNSRRLRRALSRLPMCAPPDDNVDAERVPLISFRRFRSWL